MAAATIRLYEFNGVAGATETSIDTVGGTAPAFGTSDAVQATGTTQIPTATGTKYAWHKNWGLYVTVIGTTTIGTLQVKAASSFAAGSLMFWKGDAAYVQGATIADSGSNGPATPATYTNFTTSYVTYDAATGISTGTTGKKGNYLRVAFGVDSTYGGGAGTLTLPQTDVQYQEV